MITFFVKKHLRYRAFNRFYRPLRNILRILLLCGSVLAASLTAVKSPNPPAVANAPAPAITSAQVPFVFQDASGKQVTAPVVEQSEMRKLTPATATPEALGINPVLVKAATIAQERANAHSKRRCWRYVKEALLAAGAVDSYPQTALAKEAGDELVDNFGFQKLAVTDPYQAPVGAVLVYDAQGAPGHVEIRTKTGFVSDFSTPIPSKRKLIGVYTKA